MAWAAVFCFVFFKAVQCTFFEGFMITCLRFFLAGFRGLCFLVLGVLVKGI